MVHDIPASADSQVGIEFGLSKIPSAVPGAEAFRERFMFSHSFLLDIYGNPTTLGCQMDNRVRPAVGAGQGVSQRHQILQPWHQKWLKPSLVKV
jgi:hypothetical protein